ncbi:MAG: hypothetical protein HJJLKODD_02923 [Phycisphaerae bacterium]|nr:hypothetical protein [Phycisphaerae bacterium]
MLLFVSILLLGLAGDGAAESMPVISQSAPIASDKLVLLDDQEFFGWVEKDESQRILFRVYKPDEGINYLLPVEKKHIKELIHNSGPLLPYPTTDAETRPVESPPATTSGESPLEDPAVVLLRIFEEWEIHNYESAGRQMVQLLASSDEAAIQHLDRIARNRYQISLNQFAANLQLAYSLQQARQGYFKLYYTLPRHLDESQQALSAQLEQSWSANISATTQPGDTAPARVDRIDQWIDQPGQYDGRGRDAASFAQHLTLVMGMNRELALLNQTLRRDPEENIRLSRQRERLRHLLIVVRRRIAEEP